MQINNRIFLFGPLIITGLIVFLLFSGYYLLTILPILILLVFQVLYINHCVKGDFKLKALWVYGLVLMFAVVYVPYWLTVRNQVRTS